MTAMSLEIKGYEDEIIKFLAKVSQKSVKQLANWARRYGHERNKGLGKETYSEGRICGKLHSGRALTVHQRRL
jgi:hypothetical protein